MNWIAYSSMMFFSSVALYLAVRKTSLLKVPTYLANLAMFAIPLIAYIAIGVASSTSLVITSWQGIVILVTGIVFAYGGNWASLKAIDRAPNPGYSLVLSKSYVLFTTIVSVSLLGAELTLRKAAAILLIVAFSALIMVTKKGAKKVKSEQWIVLSLAAFFAWGMLSLSSKYLFNGGVSTMTFLIYLYIVTTICIVIGSKITVRQLKDTSSEVRKILLAVGVFSILFNLGAFQAIRLAPNVGYVNAINAASISMVTLFAALFYKDELTPKKGIGIAGVTLGLVLLLV